MGRCADQSDRASPRFGSPEEVQRFRKEAYGQYEEVVRLLEESMNIYLR